MQLTLEAAIDRNRLSISFSHDGIARHWHQYILHLDELQQAFPPEHKWNITLDGRKISMDIPDCIEIGNQTPLDVELIIPNDSQALKWYKLMLLWNPMSEGRCFTLNRLLTLEQLAAKMMSDASMKEYVLHEVYASRESNREYFEAEATPVKEVQPYVDDFGSPPNTPPATSGNRSGTVGDRTSLKTKPARGSAFRRIFRFLRRRFGRRTSQVGL